MKKFLLLFIFITAGLTLAACGDRSDEDQSGPVFDEETGSFEWEEDAIIEIGVDNVSMGNAIVDQWNSDFPDREGQLEFTEYQSSNDDSSGMQGIEVGEGSAPDIALVITPEPAYLYELHEYFDDFGQENAHPNAFETLNAQRLAYMPAFYDGMAFSWNETMLTELGVDLTDSDDDGLPDAIDTWEKIFAWAESYGDDRPEFEGEEILEFFPISLEEVWSGYPSLTAGGWQLYQDGDLNDPGFDDPAFLEGLEFIKAFSETNMSVDETGSSKDGSAMGWRWDAYLDSAYPLSLVGTWQDVDGKEDENNIDVRFSPMPTWEGNQLTPLVKTKGFVINGFTENPSAAHEVLRWLYTEDTMTTMIDNSAYLPAVQEDSDIYPDFSDDQNKAEFAYALSFNTLEPLSPLPNNEDLQAIEVFYELGLGDYFIDLWNADMTPEDAQDDIHDIATAWMEEYNVED